VIRSGSHPASNMTAAPASAMRRDCRFTSFYIAHEGIGVWTRNL
jgi:hypothetical protein